MALFLTLGLCLSEKWGRALVKALKDKQHSSGHIQGENKVNLELNFFLIQNTFLQKELYHSAH